MITNLRRLVVLLVSLMAVTAGAQELSHGRIQATNRAEIMFSAPIQADLNNLKISPLLEISTITITDSIVVVETASSFELTQHYYAELGDKRVFLKPDGILDYLYSDKALGYTDVGDSSHFRVFAPRAIWVKIQFYHTHDEGYTAEFDMVRDSEGVWEFSTKAPPLGRYYTYRVHGPEGNGEMFDASIPIADPYGTAVSTLNHYSHAARTVIPVSSNFDWKGDSGVAVDPRDEVIYEMHVRDMTSHESAAVPSYLRGTYLGLIHPKQQGGLPYLKRLGVNVVELLPVQDFGNIEINYQDSTMAVYNTWNPYERNHWGYMTSYFFAPESYYASGGTMERGAYNGVDGRQVNELKTMIRELHRNDIAVYLDVVYNHVSQYDYNPFKYIDKFYYFRTHPNCDFESRSGCGNDFKTERPMARRLIIDSVIYWMTEYHVDGFRFDLATLIDWETCKKIKEAAEQVNPRVRLIAEPWHWGGYNPDGFSRIGWAAWNDQIRNGLKGWDPKDSPGFIFGKWHGDSGPASIRQHIMGTLRTQDGLFEEAAHSVNYLESHDNHTLGDFIRLATAESVEEATSASKTSSLTPDQIRVAKLAALSLLTSQGAVMLHAGQEYGRGKIIAAGNINDSHTGQIDHNSYEKDNETNWLNFDHAAQNQDLFGYYSGLIAMRSRHEALRHADPEHYTFVTDSDPFVVAYRLDYSDQSYFVALNGNRSQAHQIKLPTGEWQVLTDDKFVYLDGGPMMTNTLEVGHSAGIVLQLGSPE